jgi:hypothetical protein
MKYRTGKTMLLVVAALVLALFVVGLLELVALRFEAGDIYPPYSTLRADPLGTKAFYESLEDIGGVSVRRNYLPQEQLLPLMHGAKRGTLVYLGATEYGQAAPLGEKEPKGYTDLLDSFVAPGGRLAVAFVPDGGKIATSEPSAATSPQSRPAGAHRDAAVGRTMHGLMVRLGASLAVEKKDSAQDAPEATDEKALPATSDESFGGALAWKSALYFETTDKAWNAVVRQGGRPVIIERPFGKGSVVFCGDCYFVSNEAMVNDRRPALLAWLIGGPGEIVFDETHLGVVQQTGLAALARKYNMGYVGLALLIVGVLAIWRGNSSFVPRDEALVAGLGGSEVAGKGSWAAMVNLLRTAIGPGKIIATCLAQWSGALGRSPTASQKQAIQRANQLLATGGAAKVDVKATYNELCRAVGPQRGTPVRAVSSSGYPKRD